MTKIELTKQMIESEFLSPLKGFKKEIQVTERRKDPLTDEWCRISIERATRPVQLKGKLDEKIIKKSSEKCFFCNKRVEKSTPKYIPSLVSEGRIKVNEFILFPNLYPFCKYHAVGVLTSKHFLPVDEIKSERWKDCLEGCLRFFKIVNEKNPNARFPSINFNYLPTAGASLIHPHVQILNSTSPSVMTDLYYKKSWEYFDKNKTNYWQDLIEQEVDGERFVGRTGSVFWFTSFAPTCNNEIIGVVKGDVSSLFEMGEEEINNISEGIWRIFRCINRHGSGYNMVMFSAPLDEHLGHFFSLNIKIVSRPRLSEYYTTDRGYSEILHKEPVITVIPEDLARDLRKKF